MQRLSQNPCRRWCRPSVLPVFVLIVNVVIQIVPLGAQELVFTPIMPSVITTISPSDLDVFTSDGLTRNQVFVLYLSNSGSEPANNLRLHYCVWMKPGGSGSNQLLYECLSNTFSLSAGETVRPITSSEFFNGASSGVKAYKQDVLRDLSGSEQLKIISSTQRVPDGEIVQEMWIEQNSVRLGSSQFSHHSVINATTIEPLSPGGSGDNLPRLFEPQPVFQWVSDLPPRIYDGEPVFELQVFEAQRSETAAEAVSRIPFFTTRTTLMSVSYPTTARQFIPGRRYFWRVVGFLKGFSSATITSSPLGFLFDNQVNPEVEEVIRILQAVCTPEELAPILHYRSSVSLAHEKGALSVEELRSLVLRITSGQFEKRGVEAR